MDKTTLILLGNGLNFTGIDSQVFLPIITAFGKSDSKDLINGLFRKDVTCLKNSISKFKCATFDQGNDPWFPMAPSCVFATMRLMVCATSEVSIRKKIKRAVYIGHDKAGGST
jgi:hypothetical protein